jgi:hypothetical protein
MARQINSLIVLWGVWLWAKPSAKKIDKRIDGAIPPDA